jgi:hypothetical protein
MTARIRLPNARPSITFTMPDPNPLSQLRYEVSAGLHEGRVQEVFVACNKTTTAMDIAGRDIGVLISLALQHGADLDTLAGAITRDDQGNPQGVAGAVLDALRGV